MCDLILRKCVCIGMYTIAKQITEWCITCKKINKHVLRKRSGGRKPSLRPFQSIQVDFTELPPVRRLKYLLVLVAHLTGWVEAYPSTSAKANVVAKVIVEQIVLQFGIMAHIDSDQGSHFTSHVLKGIMEGLVITWDYHIPPGPPFVQKG